MELFADMEKKESPKCPHCKGVISNIEKLYFGKVYRCSKCKGKYFIVKEPLAIFSNDLFS